MDETKHTPGPWKVEHGEYNPAFGGILAEVKVPSRFAVGRMKATGYGRVAIKAYDVQHRDQPPTFASGEANARLIAASPDLLDALKAWRAVEEMLDTSPSLLATPEGERIYAEARLRTAAAIARVLGPFGPKEKGGE